MKLIQASEEDIKELENGSALTWEGLSEDSFQDAMDWINEVGGLKDDTCYTWKGDLFNKMYGLTGDNAYPGDCTFFCVPLEEIKNIQKLALARFQVGGRWLDDIVDNNAQRQGNANESKNVKHSKALNESVGEKYYVYLNEYDGLYYLLTKDLLKEWSMDDNYAPENLVFVGSAQDAANFILGKGKKMATCKYQVELLQKEGELSDTDEIDDESELNDYWCYLCEDPYSGYVIIFFRNELEAQIKAGELDVDSVLYATNSYRDAIEYVFNEQDRSLKRRPAMGEGPLPEYFNDYWSKKYL